MFDIKILATGSKGNCYVIEDGDSRIMIDPGISIKEIRKKCNFNLFGLDMCLVSHEHKDHCKAVKDLMRIGVPLALSAGTLKHFSPNGSLYIILQDGVVWERCGWKILPFAVEHDAEEPLGFLIESPSGKKICYATDTNYMHGVRDNIRYKYEFSGVTHWMIEANYSEELLQANESLPEDTKSRIRTSHFEINNLMAFFKAQDLSATEKIYLIHLSDDNSDQAEFIRQIKKVTGKIVV